MPIPMLPPSALPPFRPHSGEPIYRQIYARLRNAIAEQLLRPGDRIPAARALALELGVARGTVEAAYALLSAEGYVETRAQAGTVVTQQLPPLLPPSIVLTNATAPSTLAAMPATQGPLPFQMGLPALDAFPRKLWARLAARSIRATGQTDMLYPPSAGLPALRTEIATYLQLSRGVACSPEQVFVTSSYRETLQLIAAAVLTRGDQVWVEDPGYAPTAAVLTQAGMLPVPVAVDDEGLQLAQAVQTAPTARAVVVTPAHQSPLCVALSLPRRLALLDWAARHDGWIVEDDYDGEYRYVGRPLPALKSLDHAGRVLYAGTFSKVLFPGVRLAYLVVPPSQLVVFQRAAQACFSGAPLLTQHIVSDFIGAGHFARHLQRMRKLYAERRLLVTQALQQVLGDYVQIHQPPGGMHLILHLRGRRSDRALAARMRADGMAVHALSERSVAHPVRPGLLLSFTNIATAELANQLGQRILALLK